MRGNPILLAFNRGIMSPRALARVDLKKTALAAEECTNWLPRTLGSMSLRPGTEYLASVADDNAAVILPFVFSTDDTALIELTDGVARVWVDDAVLTAPSVATTIANGAFGTDLASWTDADEAGATSAWSAGAMALTGTGTKKAIRHQALTIAAGDQNVAHSLLINTSRIAGNCEIRIGTTLGGTQLAGPIVLRPGSHVVTFVPTGATAHVHLSNQEDRTALINDVSLVAAGPIEIPTVWAEADLPNVRWEQSGDVIFLCDGAHKQQRIERWGSGSWSVVDYRAADGPFLPTNTSPITLTSAVYATPPHEVSLEEIYYYRIAAPEGYALQQITSPAHGVDELIRARDGDLVLIPWGYHPVVAPPGYDVYYLNALAGSAHAMTAADDPRYAWVRESWPAPDPRVPLVR